MAFDSISLSRSYGGELAANSPVSSEQDGKHLYLDDPRVVELPEEGCITFRFKRGPVTLVEGSDNRPGRASVDLTLVEICDVKAEELREYGVGDESDQTESTIDSLFEKLRGEKEPEPAAEE